MNIFLSLAQFTLFAFICMTVNQCKCESEEPSPLKEPIILKDQNKTCLIATFAVQVRIENDEVINVPSDANLDRENSICSRNDKKASLIVRWDGDRAFLNLTFVE